MDVAPTAPAWTHGASGTTAFVRGLIIAASTPGAVLFLTALGFGTLVRDAGLPLGNSRTAVSVTASAIASNAAPRCS